MTVAIAFRRTVWSTTIDSGDERNECVLWSGSATGVARLLIAIQLVAEHVGRVRVTPSILLSNDGGSWTPATWVGTPPWVLLDTARRQLGPFAIDPSHCKRLLRVSVTTESATTGLVVGAVVGQLNLLGP